MTDTPQDKPQDDPSSSVDDVAAETTTSEKGTQEQADRATSSESKKPWWKFWG
jgi:hypothetical protein